MKRRATLALIGSTMLARGRAAGADDVVRVAVIGPAEQPRYAALVAGVRQGLGTPGRRVEIIEAQVARGDVAGAAAAARRVHAEGVAVILAVGSEMARPARQSVPDMPIVFVTPGDPVASGLVASLARPGGNMTGITFEFPELSAKRLELARELVGGGRRILVIADPRDASPRQGLAAVREAARALGMELAELEFTSGGDIARVARALPGAAALLLVPGGAPSAQHAALIRAAHDARVATVVPAAAQGGRDAVITYGAGDADVARDAARLIDRILDGASAGDLPVERPARITLVVNLRVARTIGLAVPQTIVLRADEVIE